MTAVRSVRWHDVMPVRDLWVGELVGVVVAGVKVLVLNADGKVRAFEDRCPHLSSPLSEGVLDEGVLKCSTHLWAFDCLTGAGINPQSGGLRTYPVRVQDGMIQVGVTDPPA
jgi:toluene monooxygenase system ferredoxin subunit